LRVHDETGARDYLCVLKTEKERGRTRLLSALSSSTRSQAAHPVISRLSELLQQMFSTKSSTAGFNLNAIVSSPSLGAVPSIRPYPYFKLAFLLGPDPFNIQPASRAEICAYRRSVSGTRARQRFVISHIHFNHELSSPRSIKPPSTSFPSHRSICVTETI